MSTTSSASTRTIRLRNKTDKQQQLWLEPLGDFVQLQPNGLYEIIATNALEEIDLSADGFTVYGWVEQVCEVRPDGVLATVWKVPG
jgi:hypothetical protein